jgi:aminomethyltransferase
VSKIAEDGAQYSRPARSRRRRPGRPLHLPLGPDRFLTVTNASNHEKDLAWFEQHAREFDE